MKACLRSDCFMNDDSMCVIYTPTSRDRVDREINPIQLKMKYDNTFSTTTSNIIIVSNNWILTVTYIHSKINIHRMYIRRNTMKISTLYQ